MRPSAEIRPPGIYPAIAEPVRKPLQIADTRTVGFVGLAQKGPVDEPTRISNWDEFVEIFGYETEYYLSDTVEAFFRNGGVHCYVVRVAHMARDGAERTLEHAACAEQILVDDWSKPALRVHASSEGRWGNNIFVECKQATGATELLTRDLDIGAGEAHVTTTRGFEVGQLVKIFDRETEDYVILTEVDQAEKIIRWGAETPVNRRHRASAPTQAQAMEFEIHIAQSDRREVFKKLQMHPSSRHYAPRVVASRSRLVRLDDLATKSPPPHNLPETLPRQKLGGGRDGSEAITPEDFIGLDRGPGQRSGLTALGLVEEVAILAAPDAMQFCERDETRGQFLGKTRARAVQDAMVILCENHKDRFAILDCPRTRDVEEVKDWRRRTDSSYAAYYWPWIVMEGQQNPSERVMPPSGLMAGIYAYQEDENGVHHAPANVPIVGARDIELRVTEDHLGQLSSEAINGFRVQRGIRPWGARTSSSDPDWRYVNVRRVFVMLRRSLEEGLAWVPYEPNDQKTWANVEDKVADFLRELWERGMFAGGNPEEAFYVKCDEETNPPDQVDRGMLLCQIGVAPVIPAEFIIIQVVQNMGGEI